MAVPRDPAAVDAAVHDGTAAVLLEPIQGETGVNCSTASCWRRRAPPATASARRSCSTRSRPGWGGPARSGPTRPHGRDPDAITVAKALGGGLPAGALITGERLADVLRPGDHGSTFAGGPVIAAAAHAALDVLDDEALLARVRELGNGCASGSRSCPA